MSTRPLQGLRVLDLTNVLAGPFCCHQLAFLGADVIKVEVPGSGDLARALGADPDLNRQGMGVSFLAQNAGKRSITINLKHPAGHEVFLKLAASAQVLVENFRPGVMDRLGLGAERLGAANPALVYCAISGFGQTGPLSETPAYDQIVQGMSGVMSVTGSPESAPWRVGYPVADTIGGITAYLPLAGLVDIEAEQARLQKELDEVVGLIARSEALLANDGFTANAPEEVVSRERDKLARLQATRDSLQERLEALG